MATTQVDLRRLDHGHVLHTALSFVLTDEGFALPTAPAKKAQETAEKVLEWSSENKDAFEDFSGSLVTTLLSCFNHEIKLGRFRKHREKMWSKYHKVRSSQSFQTTWIAFLNKVNCQEAGPIFTRCAYAQGRVKRLSQSIYLFVCVCVCVCGCVCRQKTRLFAVLPLENRHEIALYRSASQFIFFERCLESRTSLLSSAMAMGF